MDATLQRGGDQGVKNSANQGLARRKLFKQNERLHQDNSPLISQARDIGAEERCLRFWIEL